MHEPHDELGAFRRMDRCQGTFEGYSGESFATMCWEHQERLEEFGVELGVTLVGRNCDDRVAIDDEQAASCFGEHLVRGADNEEILDIRGPPWCPRRWSDRAEAVKVAWRQPFRLERHVRRPTRAANASAVSSLTSPVNWGLRNSTSRDANTST